MSVHAPRVVWCCVLCSVVLCCVVLCCGVVLCGVVWYGVLRAISCGCADARADIQLVLVLCCLVLWCVVTWCGVVWCAVVPTPEGGVVWYGAGEQTQERTYVHHYRLGEQGATAPAY